MVYIYILVAAGAAAHAFMFGRWLYKNGNKTGAFTVYFIAAVCISVPVYRFLAAP